MDLVKWLLSGNENMTFLTRKYIMNEQNPQSNHGYISSYLSKYDEEKSIWGNGFYGPKWISSTYTLLDLVSLEALPTKEMINGYTNLLENISTKYTLNPTDKRTQDLCIVGMMIKLGSYVEVSEYILKDYIDFTLHTVNDDGAWNCYYNYREYKTSSLHTSINLLEGLALYVQRGYKYRLSEIKEVIKTANEFILKKKLIRSRRTGDIIHQDFTEVHFPVRWKYDYLRALEYFASVNHPYDDRMDEGLQLIRTQFTKKQVMPKGKSYAGKIHFKMDLDDYKRMNTLRALKVLKLYDKEFFESIIQQ